jgi:DNA repair exonuclease SbcCD ATPase subunit
MVGEPMFLRKIFGKKPKVPEPQVEKLSIDSLEERVDKLKRGKLAEAQSRLNTMFDRLSEERGALLKELKTLSEVEPTEEAYLGLHKAALEARRLLADKLTRAATYIQRRGEFSTNDLVTLDGKLTKMVNLMTEAIGTHSRYVRALFGPHLNAIELRLRRLHGLVREVHALIEGTREEMRSLDLISSKISSQRELLHRIESMRTDAKSSENQVAMLEKLIENESDQLARLINSKEFKALDASGRELERIEREIAQVKDAASSAISGLSRPFRKMEKLVRAGECQMDRERVKVLELCIENPLEVLSSNEKIASTDTLLQKMIELLDGGKISMGDHERKKRMELARELLEEKKLLKLKERLIHLHARREIQKRAREQTSLFKQKAELEGSIEKHKSDLKRTRATIEELHHESQRAEKDIDKNLRELEKLATKAIGATIELTS